ncbi:MAG: hypothetical protein K0S20_482 [Patescibacteria group bacterium]|jgi:LPXTG-motif cell wall-anchored protein|nr:hypothetical protein [Patescibacteria group bacterium]
MKKIASRVVITGGVAAILLLAPLSVLPVRAVEGILDDSISELTPTIDATATPVAATATPTATALPTTGASSNMFFVLLAVLLVSGAAFLIAPAKKN